MVRFLADEDFNNDHVRALRPAGTYGVLALCACARRGAAVAPPTPPSRPAVAAAVPPPPPDPGAIGGLPNSGPTLFVLTLYGVVPGGGGRRAAADSVVVFPERPGCADGGLLRFRSGGSAPVAAGGAFELTVRTQASRPCLRVAAARAGRLGPATEVRPGPLAPRYNGAPAAPEDSARVTVPGPP